MKDIITLIYFIIHDPDPIREGYKQMTALFRFLYSRDHHLVNCNDFQLFLVFKIELIHIKTNLIFCLFKILTFVKTKLNATISPSLALRRLDSNDSLA